MKVNYEYCPYKEYWFGASVMAQHKPSGCKFKRGDLLTIKDVNYLINRAPIESGQSGTVVDYKFYLDEDKILLLLNYDSRTVKHKVAGVFDGGTRDRIDLNVVEHEFTFLDGEKTKTFKLRAWGRYSNYHNEMWRKARKPPPPHPKKSPPSRGQGFSIDE